jgi:chromosomal replication initiation ATPase DnaA
MTNLIERLRDKAARFHRMHWKRDYEDISEAADEIERLRHEIDVQCSSEYVERILKEIERLKAELFTMRNVFHQQDAEIERLCISPAGRRDRTAASSSGCG